MFRVIFLFFLLFVSTLNAISAIEAISEAEYDEKKALLGKDLFFDKRLSDKRHSCQSCHHLVGELTGTTSNFPSPPSVLNSSLNFYYRKNGEKHSLKKQIESIFYDLEAYNTNPKYFIAQIKKNPSYVKRFKEIYGVLSFENALDALNEFIIALRAPSRFDRFLAGDDEAINDEEKEGYRVFVKTGCIACHNGANLGGGIIAIIKKENGSTYTMRVPSLRNVKVTGPWMSFGSRNLLSSILWLKNSIINTNITPSEIMKIIVFFDSLTSDVPSILEINDKKEDK